MEISITGHHITVRDSIRNYVNKRLKKVENHFRQPTSVDVILRKEGGSYRLEATLHGKKMSIHAHSHSTDIFRAIDAMSSKLDRQVLKHKERLTNHGKNGHGAPIVRYRG